MAELPFPYNPTGSGLFSGPGTDPGYFTPKPRPVFPVPHGPVEPVGLPFFGGGGGIPKPNPTPMPFFGPTPGDNLTGVPRQGPSLPLPFFGPGGDAFRAPRGGDSFMAPKVRRFGSAPVPRFRFGSDAVNELLLSLLR